MTDYIKLVGTKNPAVDGTESYIVKGEKEGENVTVKRGEPIQLSGEDKQKLESLGAVFEKSSAEEHKQYEANRPAESLVGQDAIVSGPVLGNSQEPVNQPDAGTDQATSQASSAKTTADKK